jgi:hypothetical protein
MHDDIVRWPDRPVTPGRVAVITGRSTRELTALVVVTATDSDVGRLKMSSRQRIERRIRGILARIAAAGGCRLVANATSRMRPCPHRPCPSLPHASQTSAVGLGLDSDVVISRPDALKKALGEPTKRRPRSWAIMVGPVAQDGRFLTYSLLIDSIRVWRDGSAPSSMG